MKRTHRVETGPFRGRSRAAPRSIVAAAGLAALGLLSGCQRADVPKSAPTVADARAFYAAQPRFLRPVPYSEVPEGLPDLTAATCGVCHVEIYEEWRVSTHARAWLDDAQFQEELKKTTAEEGRDASWICVNCHTPMENQLPRLVARLEKGDRGRPVYVDNPNFDPALQEEAITCATCHVRNGVVLGPFGDTIAPHPVAKSEELLSAAVCTQCHEANETLHDVELACIFDTGTSFASGPWAAEGKVCQDCHMPEISRPLVSEDSPVRKTRRHWFGGSRIPKKPEFEAELAPLLEAYPDGARIEWIDPPASLAAGSRGALRFRVTNAEAGHTLPTGDVERYLLVTARVVGEAGTIVAERVERFGTRYQWDPEVVKLEDNRLAPRETRTFSLEFIAPAEGPLSLQLEGSNHRISPENMAYHALEGRTVPSRVFYQSAIELPVVD